MKTRDLVPFVPQIRNLKEDGCGVREISDQLGISSYDVRKVLYPDSRTPEALKSPALHG